MNVGQTVLELRNVSVGFATSVVLKEAHLQVRGPGITALLGPSGVGKSTLLRTLGRWNELHPSFWMHGALLLRGEDLRALPLEAAQERVALLAQKARLYTATVLDNAIAGVRAGPLGYKAKREIARRLLSERGLWETLGDRLDAPVTELSIVEQRMLSLTRLVSSEPDVLLADEPLRDTVVSERGLLVSFLRRLGQELPIVMVTHDQELARQLATDVCLLSARRIVETGRADRFFTAPTTELGRSFVESGNCWPRIPSVPPPIGRDPSWRPTPAEAAVRPGGFHWILPGGLAGMQCPGLLREVEDDLSGLETLGIGRVVTLTEDPFPSAPLASHGLRGTHFPIVDMGVPECGAAVALSRQISAWIDDGTRVVLHCKAGLGRTGTMLACVLMFRGASAVEAIHRVRSVNPLYIQSEEQLSFIAELEPRMVACRPEADSATA